jgi:hypothetical protein
MATFGLRDGCRLYGEEAIMLKTVQTVVVFTLILLAAGCLRKETSQVLYMAPDGGVVWTVTETDVYSDLADPAARWTEEEAYLVAARNSEHPMALGLLALGPDKPVRTVVVRSGRPITVVTEATFDTIERAMTRLFLENGMTADARVEWEGRRATLTVRLHFSTHTERESPASVLLEEPETMAWVLTGGRFVEAQGFDLDGARKATLSKAWLDAAEDAYEAEGTIALVLTWVID